MTFVPPALAAILHPPGFATDGLLVMLARRLSAAGLRLGGVVQHAVAGAGIRPPEMRLEDLASGRTISISLDRGPGARGCRLDTAGLAEAAGLVGASLQATPDLVIINKFGRQEAGGGGLRAEIGLAMIHGLPLLTAVSEPMAFAWSAFAGPDWTQLPPDARQIERWCMAAARAPAMLERSA